MQPAKTLIRILFGSHLYGTSTESSDLDYKGVFLPAGRDILLQQVPKVINNNTKSVFSSEKNTPEDVDDEAYALQKYIGMIVAGDMEALSMFFAPTESIVEMNRDWYLVKEYKDALLNSKCKGFVSYVQQQAAKYGIRGSRMAAVEDLVALLAPFAHAEPKMRLEELADALSAYADRQEHARIIDLEQPGKRTIPHLEVVERKFGYTTQVKEVYDVVNRIYENYGHRARAAKDNDGIDWKAISHAVRVSEQAVEFLSTGFITFPRPNADFLLQIKRGEIPFDTTAPILEQALVDVHAAAAASPLPEESNQAAIDDLVLTLHHAQLTED
jgi:hypothetical protein